MNKNQSRFIGTCIYCGASGASKELTDEHVVPLGLNGTLILEKASCKACAAITGTIEQTLLRGMLLEARTHLRMKTRRPKERPTAFPAFRLTEKGIERHNLPVAENPFLLRLPNLLEPPLRHRVSNGGLYGHQFSMFWTRIGVNNEAQRRSLMTYSKQSEYPMVEFFLFLAKIAHGCAVYFRGLEGFEPFLPKLILSRSDAISDYVGGCRKPHEEMRRADCHINMIEYTDNFVVEICLFAQLGAPYYEVLAGKSKAV